MSKQDVLIQGKDITIETQIIAVLVKRLGGKVNLTREEMMTQIDLIMNNTGFDFTLEAID